MNFSDIIKVQDATEKNVRRILQKWVNAASPKCRVYVVKHNGRVSGVSLSITGMVPIQRHGIEYVKASEYGIIKTYPLP